MLQKMFFSSFSCWYTHFLLLSLFVSGGAGRFLPSRTTATRWTGDIVLCYMDARSTGAYGPEAEELFRWNSAKFGRLLAYHNDSADRGGGYVGVAVCVCVSARGRDSTSVYKSRRL